MNSYRLMIEEGKGFLAAFKALLVNPHIEIVLAVIGTIIAWLIDHLLQVGMYLFIGTIGVVLNYILSLLVRYKTGKRELKDTFAFAVLRALGYVVTVYFMNVVDIDMIRFVDLKLAYAFSSAFVGLEVKIALKSWDKINDTNTFGFIKDKLDILTKNKRKDENEKSNSV